MTRGNTCGMETCSLLCVVVGDTALLWYTNNNSNDKNSFLVCFSVIHCQVYEMQMFSCVDKLSLSVGLKFSYDL